MIEKFYLISENAITNLGAIGEDLWFNEETRHYSEDIQQLFSEISECNPVPLTGKFMKIPSETAER